MTNYNWMVGDDSLIDENIKHLRIEGDFVIANSIYFFEEKIGDKIVEPRIEITGFLDESNPPEVFRLVIWPIRLHENVKVLEIGDKIRIKAYIKQFRKRLFGKDGKPMIHQDGTMVTIPTMVLNVYNVAIL